MLFLQGAIGYNALFLDLKKNRYLFHDFSANRVFSIFDYNAGEFI